MIDQNEILNIINTELIGKKIFTFDSIDSTNDCGKVLSANGQPEGSVIIAEYQTKGHGRFQRDWISESGKNLLFSIILKPVLDEKKLHLLTFFLANSIAEVIEELYPLKLSAKWPNDLIINEKKFCGILLESVVTKKIDTIICGIGINVNQTAFPENLLSATSIKRELHHEVDRIILLKNILEKLDTKYGDFLNNPDSEINVWKSRDVLKGKTVSVFFNQNNYSGQVIDIDAGGYLVLRTKGNKRLKFYSGDVSLKSSIKYK
jgi:BirA family transcriptional regulator, biotin operon repressor / biotin---[acetyl-CoA-carboxylase] ligase